MLSFDIETEGLEPRLHRITVAAVCDRAAGIRRCYNFLTGDEQTKEDFLADLDNADSLCSFNGVQFDLPFIIQRFKVERERYEPWFLKLFDYYDISKKLFEDTFSLGTLLQKNGFNPKSGTGTQAIAWAREKKYDKLMEYCQDDADLTYDISVSKAVILPFKKRPAIGVAKSPDENNHSIASFDGDF
jgi:hypothetical protein